MEDIEVNKTHAYMIMITALVLLVAIVLTFKVAEIDVPKKCSAEELQVEIVDNGVNIIDCNNEKYFYKNKDLEVIEWRE